MSGTRKHGRRWFQYSLRSLMLLTLLVSIGMSSYAVMAKRAREQKETVEQIKKLDKRVQFAYELPMRELSSRPYGIDRR